MTSPPHDMRGLYSKIVSTSHGGGSSGWALSHRKCYTHIQTPTHRLRLWVGWGGHVILPKSGWGMLHVLYIHASCHESHTWLNHVTYLNECVRVWGGGRVSVSTLSHSKRSHKLTFTYTHRVAYACTWGGEHDVSPLRVGEQCVMSHNMNALCHIYEWVSELGWIKGPPGARATVTLK